MTNPEPTPLEAVPTVERRIIAALLDAQRAAEAAKPSESEPLSTDPAEAEAA